MRRAKDNPYGAQRLAGLSYRGEALETLAGRFEQMGRRAAIVGPHGSGKSTLLRGLLARLAAAGYEVRAVVLHQGERWLTRAQRRRLWSRIGPRTLLAVDGAEQLSALAWRELALRARQAAGLLVTSHREGLLPTLHACATTPGLLSELAESLSGEELPKPLCAEIHTRHAGNLRDAFWELYDRWAGRALPGLLLVAVVVLLGGCQRSTTAGLQELLDKVREEVGAPGAILGVEEKHGDRTIVSSGLADRDTGSPMVPDAPYYLGSIAKTYTAVTVLRLAEEGRLSLDDTVASFLPSFPRGNEITVRQLLDHTSGLKDFYMHLYYRPEREEMIELVTKGWTQDELLALSGRFGHWFDPGTDWSYSSTNYFLLGVIIEKAGGEPLPEAYGRYLYQPLGLYQTWLAWHEEAKGPLPTGYLGPVERWQHSEMFGALGPTTVLDRSPVEWGAGGLAAPAEDALRFLHGLFAGELLKPASLAAMTQFRATPQLGGAVSGDSSEDGYGLGLVKLRRAGYTLVGHGGLFTGHTAGLWHLPDCGLTIALYFNRGFVNQRAALDRIVPAVTRNPDGSTRCEPGPGV